MRLELEPHDRVAVLGITGTGKSTWTKEQVARWVKAGVRVVAFDPDDEYSRAGRRRDQVVLGDLRDRVAVDDLRFDAAALSLLDDEALSLSIVPSDDPEECAEDFAYVAELLRRTGNLLLVVEELGSWEEYARAAINRVACRDRKNGIAVVWVAQRAIQVPKTARSQLSQVVAFRQDDPDDLEALAKRTQSEEFAARVGALARHEFEHWRSTVPTKGRPERKAA